MLLLILFLVTLVLFALFLGGSLVAQGYLYQQPADKLPLRSLVAAALVGLFITMWVAIDRAAPRKYDTFFEFTPYERKEFSEFEAVRWISPDGTKLKTDADGKPVEVVVKFKKGSGANIDKFLEEGTDTPFQLNSSTKSGSSYMTAAFLVRPEPEAEPVRFDAQFDKRSATKTYAPGAEGRKFEDAGKTRYIMADQLGVIYVPSTWTVIKALALNFLHFLAWFVAFWLILQFTRGHALLLTIVFGLTTMLLVLPLLFKPNRMPKTPEAPKTAAISGQETRDRKQG